VLRVRERLLPLLRPVVLASVPILLLAVGGQWTRGFLVAAAVVLYFAAYPAIQFHERHYFFLDVLGWFLCAFACDRVVALVRQPPMRGHLLAQAKRASSLALALLIVLIVPLASLRAYQGPRVEALLSSIAAAPSHPLESVSRPLKGEHELLEFPALSSAADEQPLTVRSEYLRIDGANCALQRAEIVVRYDDTIPDRDFSHSISLEWPTSQRPAPVFFPVFYCNGDRGADGAPIRGCGFAGLDVSQEARPCVRAISRVNPSDVGALLLTVRLADRWQQADHFQTVSALETRRDPPGTTVYTQPPDLPFTRTLLDTALEPAGDVAEVANVVRVMPSSTWTVDGFGGIGGSGRFNYLLRTVPVFRRRGQMLIVQGELTQGGLGIGLQRDSRWVSQLIVDRVGQFVAVIAAPEDGDYQAVVSNNLRPWMRTNRAVAHRMGWTP